MSERIYLDFNASTPVAHEVAAAMAPFLEESFGNPSSLHWASLPARDAVETARSQAAALLCCDATEVVFTSGGTEANNQAIKGLFFARRASGKPFHIITSQIEHPAVLEPCRFLESLGAEVTLLPVDRYGLIDPNDVRRAVRPHTALVSIMHANNEVGVIQPLQAIAEIARERGILFHTDAAQSVGKIPATSALCWRRWAFLATTVLGRFDSAWGATRRGARSTPSSKCFLAWGRHRMPLRVRRILFSSLVGLLAAALVHCTSLSATAGESDSFFASRVAPILSQRCAACHNGEKRSGGLDLTSREALLAGGDSGSAVVPGKVDESRLIEMVGGDEPEMPQNAKPLSAAQLGDLRTWIEKGAQWPAGVEVTAELWSLRTISRPSVPEVRHSARVKTPIDAFVLQRLEEEKLEPAPAADRIALVRRATFDLHGLPPTLQEIDAFLADNSDQAFAKLIERLLASPRYGERWGRHWLDLANYADSHGFELDYPRPNAWRYRDYVIQAFNDDKPYDQFLLEQLAGDALSPDEPSASIATGFLAAGPWDYSGYVTAIQGTAASRGTRLQDLDNMLTTVMTTAVGLTVGCAKCHDHKFDPISQKDYYSLQAVFAGVRRGDRISRGRASAEQARRMEQIRLDIHKKRIGVAELDARAPEARTEETVQTRAKLCDEIAALEAEYAQFPEVELTYAALAETPPATHVLYRGDTESPRDEVAPAALSAVKGLKAELTGGNAPDGARRIALARWLVDTANPLTARVMVNRLWHYHFGRGIVGTPGDFGFNGERPSHPELLDWLASEFQRRKWSVKEMHRLIMLSSTYQQSSRHDARAAAVDAGNRLLWRINRRRLDAEEVRDSILAASGKLEPTMGGPADVPFRYQFRKSPVYDYLAAKDRREPERRSIYNFIARSTPDPFMDVLDFPVPSTCTPARSSTNTPLQSLSLLNDPFVIEQADAFAARLAGAHKHDVCAQVSAAYRLTLGRSPTPPEAERAERFIAKHELFQFCRALFNANEFLYVD